MKCGHCEERAEALCDSCSSILTRQEQDSHSSEYVQLIPANGWYAVYNVDGKEERSPLVAWALTRGGFVHAVDADVEGAVAEPDTNSNFVRIEGPK